MINAKERTVTLCNGDEVTFVGRGLAQVKSKTGTEEVPARDIHKLMTAIHETTHFCAAILVNAMIIKLHVGAKSGRPIQQWRTRGAHGFCRAQHTDAPEDAFITLAGWAMEYLHGFEETARADSARAARELTDAENSISFKGDACEIDVLGERFRANAKHEALEWFRDTLYPRLWFSPV